MGIERKGTDGGTEEWEFVVALQGLSIFWTFVDKATYYDKYKMAFPLKIIMISTNVYNFFVRQWCTQTCIDNLRKTFDEKHNKNLGIKTSR